MSQILIHTRVVRWIRFPWPGNAKKCPFGLVRFHAALYSRGPKRLGNVTHLQQQLVLGQPPKTKKKRHEEEENAAHGLTENGNHFLSLAHSCSKLTAPGRPEIAYLVHTRVWTSISFPFGRFYQHLMFFKQPCLDIIHCHNNVEPYVATVRDFCNMRHLIYNLFLQHGSMAASGIDSNPHFAHLHFHYHSFLFSLLNLVLLTTEPWT